MNQVFKRLKKAFPFLGERAVTEDDVHAYAGSRGLQIVFSPSISNACYVVCDGREFIFVNHKLKGRRLLHRLCHELAHAILHVPRRTKYGVEFFGECTRGNHEIEAEAAAALLMMPLHEINDQVFTGIFKYDIELENMITVRRSYASKFGK